MDLTISPAAASELAAAFLQATITVGLAVLCGLLYRRYRKPYFGYWAIAWLLYAVRLQAIITFLLSGAPHWLYWHQVTTGWTALAILWAALVFSRQIRWRPHYALFVLFPPVWSYVAIYRLDDFLLAAGPAVLFLSFATLWTGWVLFRYHRQVRSAAAALMSGAMFLWALHHLDYPFLRARGAWNPWGYYLDILFELAMGIGILLLVLEDTSRGLGTVMRLSSDLQRGRTDGGPGQLLRHLLSLPGVDGSALYQRTRRTDLSLVATTGACNSWSDEPVGAVRDVIEHSLASGTPEISRGRGRFSVGAHRYAYAASVPVAKDGHAAGALVIVGDVREPFATLDKEFLAALGRQVGAALENADLYRRLEGRTRELERLAGRMVQQHEEERRRLSRELHDETAQVFSAVRMQLGIARETVSEHVAPRIDRALGLVDEGIQSIRNVARHLRPTVLDDLGLLPALRALVSEFDQRNDVDARLELLGDPPTIETEAELALFRALQEGLSNVEQHAQATSALATLGAEGPHLVLRLRDDGRGLPVDFDLASLERNGHMGIVGMRQRIIALGGQVELQNAADMGAELVVRLPPSEGA